MKMVAVEKVGKKLFFGGNWKAAMKPSQIKAFVANFAEGIKEIRKEINMGKLTVMIAPPAACLVTFRQTLGDYFIRDLVEIGVQDPWHKSGAYTGATTLDMAKDPLIDAHFAIIGHSETREPWRIITKIVEVRDVTKIIEEVKIDSEKPGSFRMALDPIINKMVKESLLVGITPILCVGETLEEREAKLTDQVILRQLEGGLAGLAPEQILKVIIAYEPVWAIGTGKTATPEQAEEVHAMIAAYLMEKTSMSSKVVPSVSEKNVASLVSQPDIHGGLIGGASLKPDVFMQLILNGLKTVA